jgi:hypothetical protein
MCFVPVAIRRAIKISKPRKLEGAMKTIFTTIRWIFAVLALGTLFSATRAAASAGDVYLSRSPASVIAHLPLSAGVAQMFLRHQGKTQLLYVQRPSQPGFTVIDVTKPDHPR